MKIGTIVVFCGIIVLFLGVIVLSSYFALGEQSERAAREAKAEGGMFSGIFEGLAKLEVYILWMRDSFLLLIINLFVSGIALILTGYTLQKLEKQTN